MTKRTKGDAPDLFSVDPSAHLRFALDRFGWPAGDRFPVNRAGSSVRSIVWADLVGSARPVVVAGFSAIDEIVALIAEWSSTGDEMHVLLGTEPFTNVRRSFLAPRNAFTRDARSYWLEERGISLRLSAKVIQALAALDEGKVSVRFVHGASRLHAKVYIADAAATVGSSNFTGAGLMTQLEANARFDRGSDPARYDELADVANNLWAVGAQWDDEFRDLLESLLRVVTWQEALARACAELLEGEWAAKYVAGIPEGDMPLWPSQRLGIAQALWIVENVGSVLVADATGSGKTRMGAHLVRAIRDSLWRTGRARTDLTVLVCPPAVEDTWRREAVTCGLSIHTVSHGLLSRAPTGQGTAHTAVHDAQILAVDEAHNFLNREAHRTQQLRESTAEHMALFTATPISRGATDLLDLVALLGADNFEDETLDALARLEKGRGRRRDLPPEVASRLRKEIQRFTLRRTKSDLNQLVDREPDAYVHPATNRICRYPAHEVRVYATGESVHDAAAADRIRDLSSALVGVTQLPRVLSLPTTLQHLYTEEAWLRLRLMSARGLATHHVRSALRSSRAALTEHLLGTAVAAEAHGLGSFKAQASGNMVKRAANLAELAPPTVELAGDVPDWLTDDLAWRAACESDAAAYEAIQAIVSSISNARELTKAELIADLARRHERVLAFDHHPITLAVLDRHLAELVEDAVPVVVATGTNLQRKRVEKLFAPTASERAVALCSDALNEGLNLQGASAVVHLDLPTTLRVAEQRVGRVDRMDSPHHSIEAWWPNDGPSFATRANERLAERAAENEALLGSNLPLPDLRELPDVVVDVREQIQELDAPEALQWDGIQDALDPIRRLVIGDDALISQRTYREYRNVTATVLSRVAPVRTNGSWAFMTIAAAGRGAPRWLLIDPQQPTRWVVDIDDIARLLRQHLAADPQSAPVDDDAARLLSKFLDEAAHAERELLPRRMRRALDQMAAVTTTWARAAQREGNEDDATRWRSLASIAAPPPDDVVVDPQLVAERWLSLIAPALEERRRERRHARYVLLRELTARLSGDAMAIESVEEMFADIPVAAPVSERISAMILGVPG